MTVLVIAEHDNQQLKPATCHTVCAAQALGDDIHVLVAGSDCHAVAEQAAGVQGAGKVLVSDSPACQHLLAENIAPLIAGLASKYSHLLAPATTLGKDIMPRVAALLDVGQVSDITAIESEDTFVRPIYAGNALATVQSLDPVKVITVRCSAFAAAAQGETQASIEPIDVAIDAGLTQFVSEQVAYSERPELTAAQVVVSGGRGLGSSESFAMLDQLADKLDAAVGASRAAVDAGYVPNDMQVGQTGKIVAPDLYIAVGLSGAIQHQAGMKGSKVIVAINKDEDAPIFQIADYGLVADLFEAVPELTQRLS